MKKRILFILSLLIFSMLSLSAQNVKANDVVGLWYAEKDSLGRIPVVEIYEENGRYYGYSFAYKAFLSQGYPLLSYLRSIK